MKVLLIDNYDSFTYNIVHYLYSFTENITVIKNDEIENKFYDYDAIIISPGPGLPSESGNLMNFIENHFTQIKILGICLGMQALAFFTHKNSLFNLKKVKHGIQEPIFILEKSDILFKDLPKSLNVGLYHSWAVNDDIENEWFITSKNKENINMSIKNKKYPIWGVQFHPESIMTENGKQIIKNFLFS
ncbi:MAG: aminodeoxychorismate/anthranilate synthase component II [Flavobacteriia bacterium]|nr:aminodeoxychorismate/anthranilate synthase component II [Flavobacteriia bacterium]